MVWALPLRCAFLLAVRAALPLLLRPAASVRWSGGSEVTLGAAGDRGGDGLQIPSSAAHDGAGVEDAARSPSGFQQQVLVPRSPLWRPVRRVPTPPAAGSALEVRTEAPVEGAEPEDFIDILDHGEEEHTVVITVVKVHVLLLDEVVEIEIPDDDPTVGDVKDRLEERFGISTGRQILVRDRALEDEDRVSAHLTHDEDKFQLIVKHGLSIAVTFRAGDGVSLLCVMDLASNTTANQGHVAQFVDQVLRVPHNVQDFRLAGLPWNNASAKLEGLQPLNVLPIHLYTKPHVVIDATMVLMPHYIPKRILRYPFANSTTISHMRKDVVDWLATFDDFNDTVDEETNRTLYDWRFFFHGKVLQQQHDVRTMSDVGMAPYERRLPLTLDEYTTDMHIFALRRNVSEPMFNMSLKVPMREELVNITGLVQSDAVMIVGVLLAQSVLEDQSEPDGPAPRMVFQGKAMEIDHPLSEYGVYNDCVVNVAVTMQTGGLIGTGVRDEEEDEFEEYGDY